jgi:class 3 adenylate cyclase/tetratricopeptide (TPR) repeat protein
MASNIDLWLQKLGLEKYGPIFAEQEIDESVLTELTQSDLENLGLPLGPRKKILSAIQAEEIPQVQSTPYIENDAHVLLKTPSAERRQLTVMFCDLIGSTEMSQKLDPEELREINTAYQVASTGAIELFGGYVARYMGDGVLAYFGYPQAHEDDAERAVLAGLAIVEAITAIKPGTIGQDNLELAVRVGVATGPVVVGDLIGEGAAQEKAVVGETPNLAARLQGIADPNQVIVSSETQMLVGGSVGFESMGPQALKGFTNPLETWRVIGTEIGGGRFERSIPEGLGRFVGRNAELERLRADLQQSTASQHVVSHISGEPGIGKSRLVFEFLKEIGDSTKILEGHCVSHGSTTVFLPFIDMLRRTFNLSHNQDIESLTSHLSEALTSLDIDSSTHLPYLLNLLGISVPVIAETDPGLVGLRTRDALASIICAHSKLRPTVLFINNCHWIDRSSEDLLDSLVQGEVVSGVLILCTFRPEYEPQWGKSNQVSSIELNPLSLAEAKLLFSDRFGTTQSHEDLFSELHERSGGNPFFAEELAHHMQEHGQDLSSGTDPEQPVLVPKTLEGLLLQRVDRLSVETRRFLQAASVMGRSFNDKLSAEVSGLPSSDEALQELVGQDLVFPDRVVKPHGYRFKHALLQDTVYGSLLSSDRKALHQSIADGLNALYSDRESEIAEELARHYTIAKDVKMASKWAELAGEKALGLFSHGAAVSWFKQSLDLQLTRENTDQNLLGLTLANQMEARCWEIDYPGMTEIAEQHLPKIDTVGNAQHLSRIFTWLGDAYINTGRFAEALSASGKALKLAEEIGDLECTGYAMSMHLWVHSLTAGVGDFDYVEQESGQILEIAEKLDDLYLKLLTYYSLALDYVQRGYLVKAREWTTKSIEMGQQTDYSPALVWALCLQAYAEVCDENLETAELDAREAVRLAQSKYDQLMAKLTLGAVLIVGGGIEEGMKILDDTRQERKLKGLSQIGFMYWPDIVYGIGLISSDQFDAGVEHLEARYQYFLELGNRRAAGLAALTLGEACLQSDLSPNARSTAAHSLQEAARLGEESAMDGVVARALLGLSTLSIQHDDTRDNLARAQILIAALDSPALDQRLNEVVKRQV